MKQATNITPAMHTAKVKPETFYQRPQVIQRVVLHSLNKDYHTARDTYSEIYDGGKCEKQVQISRRR